MHALGLVRFTLTVDLQPHCKVTYYVSQHTGHVGPDALACLQRQRFLSSEVVERVAQGLRAQLSIAKVFTANLKHMERAWISDPNNAASCMLRFCPCRRCVSLTSSGRSSTSSD